MQSTRHLPHTYRQVYNR